MAGIGLQDDTTQYHNKNVTVEDKIFQLATTLVNNVAAKSSKPFTNEEKDQLLEDTIRRITIERNQLLKVLDEAEEELKVLKWNHVQPQALPGTTHRFNQVSGRRVTRTISGNHGFRGLYIVTFGNFVKAKNDGWIYRPNQEQFINLVRRWPKKKPCENFANDLRHSLRMTPLEKVNYSPSDDPNNFAESAAMKQLKKDLLDQLNQLRESV